MTRFEFKLPDIGEGVAEAEIVAWHVKPGDTIEEDAPVADVMTDKATVELSSPVTGKVLETNGTVGDNLPVGSVLAVFETGTGPDADQDEEGRGGQAKPPVEPPVDAAPEPERRAAPVSSGGSRERVLASPAVRQRAKDLGIDLHRVQPGGEGRIRHADLDAYLRDAGAGGIPAVGTDLPDRIEEVKITGLRRRIAQNMAEAKRHIPHFTYVEEIDVTALGALRAELNAARGDRPRLTMLPFLMKAMTVALPAFPMINARFDDEANVIHRHSAVHLGLAVQTGEGLTVPVIRDAQALDIWALAAEIARLADAARRGAASREELSGSTITLTSLGALGGIASTPVINSPEVAIIGINRMVERLAVVDGRIEIRKLMNLSSSFDHRVVDGWDAARFIQKMKQLLESPGLIFAASA